MLRAAWGVVVVCSRCHGIWYGSCVRPVKSSVICTAGHTHTVYSLTLSLSLSLCLVWSRRLKRPTHLPAAFTWCADRSTRELRSTVISRWQDPRTPHDSTAFAGWQRTQNTTCEDHSTGSTRMSPWRGRGGGHSCKSWPNPRIIGTRQRRDNDLHRVIPYWLLRTKILISIHLLILTRQQCML